MPQSRPSGRSGDDAALPYGTDGILCVMDERLRLVRHRGGKVETILPHVTRARELTPGPGKHYMVRELMPKSGRLGVIFDPDADEMWHIERKHFPFEEADNPYGGFRYAPRLDAILWFGWNRLWGVPLAEVMKGPRYRASTGRKLRA